MMRGLGIPKTEDLSRSARLQKYGTDSLTSRGTGRLQQDKEPKEIQKVISPRKAVIITAVTSAATSATGFAFSQKLVGGRISIIQTIFVGFGAGLLAAVTSLIALQYIGDEQ